MFVAVSITNTTNTTDAPSELNGYVMFQMAECARCCASGCGVA
jgi:hypothetical protein